MKASDDIEDDVFIEEINKNHDSKLVRAAYPIITIKIHGIK